MKAGPLLAFLVLPGLVSCDKASQLVDKAKTAIGSASGTGDGGKGAPPEPIAPELAKLIDRTDEGILFRKDLPFPSDVTVTVKEKEPMSVRLFESSDLGKRNLLLGSRRETSWTMHLTRSSFQVSNFKEAFLDEFIDEKTKEKSERAVANHPLQIAAQTMSLAFVKTGDRWGAGPGQGFASVAAARELGPVMPTLLQEFGLAPRTMWFGRQRIQPGRAIEVSGTLLPMLLPGEATGSLTLTLEDIESVHGHPCGRFAIKGSYQRRKLPSLDGRFYDEDTTIESGHVWLSVLHPLVLRQRVQRIVTRSVAEGTGAALRLQGSSSPERSVEWRPAS